MSKYTTGEMAKLCGVSVRTVQYYDTRGILVPTELSDGGRRLYTDDDLSRMKIVCFLRGLGFSLDNIAVLLREEHPERVISLLLSEQEKTLRAEICERETCAEQIAEVKRTLAHIPSLTVDSIGDIAYIMENKTKMKKLHVRMLTAGFLMDAIEVSTLMLWILRGIWLPFVVGLVPIAALGVWISMDYYRSVAFICPACHTIFRKRFGESFFARHTPHTRRLRCTQCGYHGFCVETYHEEKEKHYAEN